MERVLFIIKKNKSTNRKSFKNYRDIHIYSFYFIFKYISKKKI